MPSHLLVLSLHLLELLANHSLFFLSNSTLSEYAFNFILGIRHVSFLLHVTFSQLSLEQLVLFLKFALILTLSDGCISLLVLQFSQQVSFT